MVIWFIACLIVFIYFTVYLILLNYPPGPYLYGVKIDWFYYFCIPFLCAVDDIITILYGEILLCNDIKPQFQFTLISFHQTLNRAQTYFVDTVKREIQPYSFVELICRFVKSGISNFPEFHDLDDKGWLE